MSNSRFDESSKIVEQSVADTANMQEGIKQRLVQLESPYQVHSTETGEMLPVENEEDLSLALVSGKYVPSQNQIFNVITPDGKRGTVDSANIKKVLESGQARLETKAETQLKDDEEKYGDKYGQAAALGAARGLTFGGSDAALKGLGVYTGEELRGIESASPVASVAGEITGALAPAILSAGSSAAVSGAGKVLGSGLALSEAAGAKAASLVTKSLLKEGMKEAAAKSIAKRLLYNGLESGVNLATQGALQGAGRLVTENTFGTADMNAENLLAYAGMGAIAGGAFGTALGLGKAIAPSAKEFVSGTVGKLFDREKAALDLVELSPASLAKAEMKRPDFKPRLANEVEDVLKEYKPKDSEAFHKAVVEKHGVVGKEIGDIYKKADDVIANAFDKEGTAVLSNMEFKSPEAVSSNVMKAVDDHLSKLGIAVPESKLESLRKYGTTYAEKLGKEFAEGKVTATKLQELVSDLQSAIYPKSTGAPVMLTAEEDSMKMLQKSILDSLRRDQRDIVRQATQLGDNTLLDKLVSKNASYSVLSDIKYNSLRKAAKEGMKTEVPFASLVDFNVDRPLSFIRKGFESYTVKRMSVMQNMEQALNSTDSAINTMLKGMMKATTATAKGTAIVSKAAIPSAVRSLTSYSISNKIEDGKKIKPKNEDEAYNNIINNSMRALTDPESVLKESNKETASLFEHAPSTAGAIDAKYLQMLQFIAERSSKKSKSAGIFDSMKPLSVSSFEKAKMNRYLEAMENPTKVLENAKSGKLAREHVEVLKTLFPELHKKVKEKTLQFIADKKPNLNYQQKLQMGLLLDLKAHESLDPANIAGLQSMFNVQPSSDSVNYRPSGMKDSERPASMESPLESHEIGSD